MTAVDRCPPSSCANAQDSYWTVWSTKDQWPSNYQFIMLKMHCMGNDVGSLSNHVVSDWHWAMLKGHISYWKLINSFYLENCYIYCALNNIQIIRSCDGPTTYTVLFQSKHCSRPFIVRQLLKQVLISQKQCKRDSLHSYNGQLIWIMKPSYTLTYSEISKDLQ